MINLFFKIYQELNPQWQKGTEMEALSCVAERDRLIFSAVGQIILLSRLWKDHSR